MVARRLLSYLVTYAPDKAQFWKQIQAVYCQTLQLCCSRQASCASAFCTAAYVTGLMIATSSNQEYTCLLVNYRAGPESSADGRGMTDAAACSRLLGQDPQCRSGGGVLALALDDSGACQCQRKFQCIKIMKAA